MKNMFKKGNQKFKHVKVLAYNAIKFMIKTKKLFHLIKNYLSKSFYHFLKNTRIILVFHFILSHVHLWILIVSIYRKTIGQSLCRLHRYSVTLKLNDNLDVSIITSRSRLRTLSPRRFFCVQIDIIQTELRNRWIDIIRRVKNRPKNRLIVLSIIC